MGIAPCKLRLIDSLSPTHRVYCPLHNAFF